MINFYWIIKSFHWEVGFTRNTIREMVVFLRVEYLVFHRVGYNIMIA